jgi:hypothetical protein
MIVMKENPFRGPLEGVGLKSKTFLGSEIATSTASAIWALKNLDFQGPPLPMARVMDSPPSKSLSPKSTYKNRYLGNFMHMSFAAAV